MQSRLWFLLIFLFSLMLVGCQTTTTHYLGAKADEVDVVSLAAGQVDQQRWEDLYVTVDYSYERQGNRFDIDGALSFSDSSKINFNRVRDMKLKLFLLDKDMRVVDYLDIARTLSVSLDDETTFARTLELRETVVAFAFGYEGSFRDDDPESPSSEQVWKLPKRKF